VGFAARDEASVEVNERFVPADGLSPCETHRSHPAALWWERGKRDALRPAIICAVAFAISTAASYLAMPEFYFSR
jgi:hypothetical protein